MIFSGAENASRKWHTLRKAKYLHGELSGRVGVLRWPHLQGKLVLRPKQTPRLSSSTQLVPHSKHVTSSFV